MIWKGNRMHSYFKIVIKYDEEHPEAINEFQIQEELITVFVGKGY